MWLFPTCKAVRYTHTSYSYDHSITARINLPNWCTFYHHVQYPTWCFYMYRVPIVMLSHHYHFMINALLLAEYFWLLDSSLSTVPGTKCSGGSGSCCTQNLTRVIFRIFHHPDIICAVVTLQWSISFGGRKMLGQHQPPKYLQCIFWHQF